MNEIRHMGMNVTDENEGQWGFNHWSQKAPRPTAACGSVSRVEQRWGHGSVRGCSSGAGGRARVRVSPTAPVVASRPPERVGGQVAGGGARGTGDALCLGGV